MATTLAFAASTHLPKKAQRPRISLQRLRALLRRASERRSQKPRQPVVTPKRQFDLDSLQRERSNIIQDLHYASTMAVGGILLSSLALVYPSLGFALVIGGLCTAAHVMSGIYNLSNLAINSHRISETQKRLV